MKVLIGVPAFEGIVCEAQQSFFSMVYRIGRDMPNIDLAISIIYKKEQFRGRNNIIDAAIAADMDYVLMLDDDMVVPHNLLQELLKHDKEIIGALYFQRGGLYHPVIMQRLESEIGIHSANFIPMNHPMLTTDRGLHEVDVIGGGCMLFKTDVFKSIIQPYFESERTIGTDLSICGRLQDAGHKIWVDTTIELGHVGEKKIITSRSVPAVERSTAQINYDMGEDLKGYLGIHNEEMWSKMIQAASNESRQKYWGDRSTDWESVRSYYQENAQWQLLNLAYFNFYNPDPHKEWAFIEGAAMLNAQSHVIDYGAGLGHVGVGLADKVRCHVHSIDIIDSPTLQFVEWRKKHHKLDTLAIEPLYDEYPAWGYAADGEVTYDTETSKPIIDGIFAISVLDHLTRPYDALEWMYNQLKPGGFLVCEWNHVSGDEEPQHLDRCDPATVHKFLHGLGFTTAPEHNWLFFKG